MLCSHTGNVITPTYGAISDKVRAVDSGLHATALQGRPVYIQHVGTINMKKMYELTSKERMIKFHVQARQIWTRSFRVCICPLADVGLWRPVAFQKSATLTWNGDFADPKPDPKAAHRMIWRVPLLTFLDHVDWYLLRRNTSGA